MSLSVSESECECECNGVWVWWGLSVSDTWYVEKYYLIIYLPWSIYLRLQQWVQTHALGCCAAAGGDCVPELRLASRYSEHARACAWRLFRENPRRAGVQLRPQRASSRSTKRPLRTSRSNNSGGDTHSVRNVSWPVQVASSCRVFSPAAATTHRGVVITQAPHGFFA